MGKKTAQQNPFVTSTCNFFHQNNMGKKTAQQNPFVTSTYKPFIKTTWEKDCAAKSFRDLDSQSFPENKLGKGLRSKILS